MEQRGDAGKCVVIESKRTKTDGLMVRVKWDYRPKHWNSSTRSWWMLNNMNTTVVAHAWTQLTTASSCHLVGHHSNSSFATAAAHHCAVQTCNVWSSHNDTAVHMCKCVAHSASALLHVRICPHAALPVAAHAQLLQLDAMNNVNMHGQMKLRQRTNVSWCRKVFHKLSAYENFEIFVMSVNFRFPPNPPPRHQGEWRFEAHFHTLLC